MPSSSRQVFNKNPIPVRAWYFIDTHCHLDLEPLAGSTEAVLARARAAGVRRCVSIGTTVQASQANIALARRHPMVRAAVGVHPHEADGVTDEVLAAIEALARDPCVVAIGEVGLDEYRLTASRERQQRALLGFLEIAQRRRLPLLIHCRNAYEQLIELLQRHAAVPVRGVLHCASGPPEFIHAVLALGLHVSFAGNVTFPKAEALRALVPLVPDDRLLVETDAPFLAPQPVRGQTNEPAHLAHTAARLAQLRSVSVEALGELTSRNAQALFGFPDTDPASSEG